MADEEHHETFESVGAGASLTYPMQVRTTEFYSLQVHVKEQIPLTPALFSVFCTQEERSRRDQGPPLQNCRHVYLQDWQTRTRKGTYTRLEWEMIDTQDSIHVK